MYQKVNVRIPSCIRKYDKKSADQLIIISLIKSFTFEGTPHGVVLPHHILSIAKHLKKSSKTIKNWLNDSPYAIKFKFNSNNGVKVGYRLKSLKSCNSLEIPSSCFMNFTKSEIRVREIIDFEMRHNSLRQKDTRNSAKKLSYTFLNQSAFSSLNYSQSHFSSLINSLELKGDIEVRRGKRIKDNIVVNAPNQYAFTKHLKLNGQTKLLKKKKCSLSDLKFNDSRSLLKPKAKGIKKPSMRKSNKYIKIINEFFDDKNVKSNLIQHGILDQKYDVRLINYRSFNTILNKIIKAGLIAKYFAQDSSVSQHIAVRKRIKSIMQYNNVRQYAIDYYYFQNEPFTEKEMNEYLENKRETKRKELLTSYTI